MSLLSAIIGICLFLLICKWVFHALTIPKQVKPPELNNWLPENRPKPPQQSKKSPRPTPALTRPKPNNVDNSLAEVEDEEDPEEVLDRFKRSVDFMKERREMEEEWNRMKKEWDEKRLRNIIW
ncbi:hypothetical protein EJ08DRAFT_645547 [Tothia fuscella]|uniref:Uncharacterized protein n=1 Tax=Tothia fuscella TaxID=1048955 RepID=A0A9P4P1U8_9PEZI|nr:hypothetical protein EJ08DRAFT_645547 [Tothia fuscella]